MTFTINMPIFPLRQEISERRKRMETVLPGTPFGRAGANRAAGTGYEPARYSRDGFEFDVSALARLPQGSAAR